MPTVEVVADHERDDQSGIGHLAPFGNATPVNSEHVRSLGKTLHAIAHVHHLRSWWMRRERQAIHWWQGGRMLAGSRLGPVIVAALAMFVACLLVGHAQATVTSTSVVPRFEPTACWSYVPAEARARCGYLVVPESRRKPTRRTVRVAVAVVPAARQGAPRDPLLYLAGGPGGVPILQAAMYLTEGFNAERDLVLVNQRGTFLSQPALVCPGIDEHFRRVLGLRFDSAAARRSMLQAARTCRRDLLAGGINLAAFNTNENAADLADLRRVMGYRQWNVYGVSYGTDLALALLRQDWKGVRSLVLDSTVPPNRVTFASFWPNAAEGFDAFFRACARQRACRDRHPDLERRFTRLVRKLEKTPSVTVVPDANGDPVKVVTDGGALANWLVNMSFATPLYDQVPGWIDELERGRPQEIAASRLGQVAPPGFIGYGLVFGVLCSEWAPQTTKAQVLASGRRAFPDYPRSVVAEPPQFTWLADVCRVWDVPPAPPSARRLVRSDVPTLLLAGSFDAVTPPSWAEAAARRLTNSLIVTIPGVGHGVADASPCAVRVMNSFLRRPAAPDTTCVAKAGAAS